MVLGVLVLWSVALYDFHLFERKLHSLNPLLGYPCREDDAVGIERVVCTAAYAMVHRLALKNMLPDAFKHSHHDIAVREHQTEETALHFLELVLVLQCLAYLLLGALLFFLCSDFLGYSVVLGFKVVGANVMWTSDVLAHFYQHTDIQM